MNVIRLLGLSSALSGAVALAVASAAAEPDADDIAGVVASSTGSEAGVWVIAETEDLDTRFRRIVVTDDEGRFLLPTYRMRPTASGFAATVWSIPSR